VVYVAGLPVTVNDQEPMTMMTSCPRAAAEEEVDEGSWRARPGHRAASPTTVQDDDSDLTTVGEAGGDEEAKRTVNYSHCRGAAP